MKKYTYISFLLLISVLCVSCGKKVSIDNESLTQTSVALGQDGSCEMGIVEDFAKDYYKMEELEVFIRDAVRTFQDKRGEDSVVFDYMEQKDKQVHVTLKFKSIQWYAEFNQEEVKLLTVSEARAEGLLPEKLEAADKSGNKETRSLEIDSCYVAIWEGSYQLMVEGNIKYYSNSVLLNSNTIQTLGEEAAVVVFD